MTGSCHGFAPIAKLDSAVGGRRERTDRPGHGRKPGWCAGAWSTIAGPTVLEEGEALGGFSLTHWLVVALVVVILFGAGKLPRLMGDLAKGIKSFKSTMRDEDTAEAAIASRRTGDDRTTAESR
jgi:sec-independent protein translocase protein TatA